LIPAPGVDIVGPFPVELQSADLIYAAGIVAGGEHPETAKAFIEFLAGSTALMVGKAKGLHPP
jgi:ABC-type molybdate transport system substrate-binding protein